MNVAFGGKQCHIETISYSEIQCVIAMDTEVKYKMVSVAL